MDSVPGVQRLLVCPAGQSAGSTSASSQPAERPKHKNNTILLRPMGSEPGEPEKTDATTAALWDINRPELQSASLSGKVGGVLLSAAVTR